MSYPLDERGKLVAMRGFAPPRISPADPKSAASADSATPPIGAEGGTRTHTVLQPRDFKSPAAAITPPRHAMLIDGTHITHQERDALNVNRNVANIIT